MASQPSMRFVPSSATTAPTASSDPMEYVEFFLTNLWTWTASGVDRALGFLRGLNTNATFSYESGLFKVRCRKVDERYIQQNFLKLQAAIEREINDMQVAISRPDGLLSQDVDHDHVEFPFIVPAVPANNETSLEDLNIGQTEMPTSSIGDDQVMSVEVPNELRDFPIVAVWQDLQSRTQVFDDAFISEAARNAIEQAHGVQMVFDYVQKAVLIGASSGNMVDLVKTKLTTLLQDHLMLGRMPSTVGHIFFVDSASRWSIDVREIQDINSRLARSTIFDPWKFSLPQQYHHFFYSVCCLRACLEDPSRTGVRNGLWSLFGPNSSSVLGDRRPQRPSQFFQGLTVSEHQNLPRLTYNNGGVNIDQWRNDVAMPIAGTTTNIDLQTATSVDLPPATISSGRIPSNGTAARFNEGALVPIPQFNEDAPITFDHGDENLPIILPGQHALRHKHEPKVDRNVTAAHLLDQDDPVLQDPSSTLQRPMQPPKRIVVVQNPDHLPRMKLPEQHPEVEQHGELAKFIASVKRLMRPMRRRYGIVSLNAEIGRYYAYKVAESGRACNPPNVQANGWNPDSLRPKLESGQPSFFTQALTSWGNDIDYLGSMKLPESREKKMWETKSRAMFFDFHFQVPKNNSVRNAENNEQAFFNMVLEVNTQDYTWNIRSRDSNCGLVYVHCLAQHWDFQVRLSHDRPLEYEQYWGNFAQTLVESLQIMPLKLAFQRTFNEAPVSDCDSPIIVHDVRMRQVCRLQHQNQKTYLDVTKISPTRKIEEESTATYWTVQKLLSDNLETGVFSQWFEVTVSSVRLEELLEQNKRLIPGDEAEWTVEQLQQENLLTELYQQTAEVVKKMNGVGVICDNAYKKRPRPQNSGPYRW